MPWSTFVRFNCCSLNGTRDLSRPGADLLLTHGDGLVLYTDGVLDARAPEAGLTAHDLVALLAAAGAGSPQQVADVLHRAAVGASQAPRDDIAIIALRVTDRPAAEPPGGAPPAIGAATPT
jgi:hypothetical protein